MFPGWKIWRHITWNMTYKNIAHSEGLTFRIWQFRNVFCSCIIKAHYGIYLDKRKFEDDNFMDSKSSWNNYSIYDHKIEVRSLSMTEGYDEGIIKMLLRLQAWEFIYHICNTLLQYKNFMHTSLVDLFPNILNIIPRLCTLQY